MQLKLALKIGDDAPDGRKGLLLLLGQNGGLPSAQIIEWQAGFSGDEQQQVTHLPGIHLETDAEVLQARGFKFRGPAHNGSRAGEFKLNWLMVCCYRSGNGK